VQGEHQNKRQAVEEAEARMLLGTAHAIKNRYVQAGNEYGRAMVAFRAHLPKDHK
jgi:hypothetical protein